MPDKDAHEDGRGVLSHSLCLFNSLTDAKPQTVFTIIEARHNFEITYWTKIVAILQDRSPICSAMLGFQSQGMPSIVCYRATLPGTLR